MAIAGNVVSGIIYDTYTAVLAAGETRLIPGDLRYLTLLSATTAADVQISFTGSAFYAFPPGLNLRDFNAAQFYLRNNGAAPNTVVIAKGQADIRDNRVVIDSLSPLPVTVQNASLVAVGKDANGAAPTANPLLTAGSDGALTRTILTDTSGRQINVGAGANGAAVAGNPLLTAGSDGANARTILTDNGGRLVSVGAAAAGAAIVGNPVMVGGSDGTLARALSTDSTGRPIVVGPVATGVAVAGNPVGVSYEARTTQRAALADGQASRPIVDKLGRQVVLLNAIRELRKRQVTTLTASVAETTIVTQTASIFHDIEMLVISNYVGGTATRVDIRDTTGGAIILSIPLAVGQLVVIEGAILNQAAVNTNWTAQCSVASTSVVITAVYNDAT